MNAAVNILGVHFRRTLSLYFLMIHFEMFRKTKGGNIDFRFLIIYQNPYRFYEAIIFILSLRRMRSI